MRLVYTSASKEAEKIALDSIKETWKKYGERIAKLWDELIAFMDFSNAIGKMIYITNPVDALHRIIRKVTKSKRAWVSDKALIKQHY